MKHPTECRACRNIFECESLHKVESFRFCSACYNRMKEIGQIIRDERDKTQDKEILLYEGDPWGRDQHRFNPFPHLTQRPPQLRDW